MIIRRDASNRRLTERFHVSSQTLRKDLKLLDEKGICTRSSAGAILRRGTPPPADEGIRVGRAAAKLIEDGELVAHENVQLVSLRGTWRGKNLSF